MKTILNFSVLAAILMTLSSCLKDAPIKNAYKGHTPTSLNDGWQVSTATNELIDSAKLEQVYRDLYSERENPMAQSLLVFRNGKLVAEAYPLGDKYQTTFSNIQSCTKSVTSMMVGVAMQQGLLENTNIRLFDVFPEEFKDSDSLKNLTLNDVLTMRSGIQFQNNKHTLRLYKEKFSSIQYIFSLSRFGTPGEIVNYSDGDPHLVSYAIEKLTSKKLVDFADEKLFRPLGISNYKWEHSKDGITYGAFGLHLVPRDLGKLGQLLLQNGMWDGLQIIDPDYMNQALSHQVDINLNGQSYGYYFWLNPEHGSFQANGHGGQYLFVAPDKNLVIVYTAWPYTNGEQQGNAKTLIQRIYDACN